MKKVLFVFVGFFLYGTILAQTAQPNTISKTEKLYGLSKFWNEVNYNFVYLDKIDQQQWEADYIALLKEVQDTKNDYEYFRLLQKFCATLKDGHTNVWMPKTLRDNILNGQFGNYRFYLKNIDGKAIVTRINSSKKQEIPIGSEIIAVNGLPTKEYVNTFVKPFIATSTNHILENQSIKELLKAPIGTSFSLKIKKPKGRVITLKLTLKKVDEKEVFPVKKKQELLDFKWLENDIAYLGLNSFSNAKIETLFMAKLPEIKKAKKLIIDLRTNGGGNSGIATNILKHLTNDTELLGSASSSRSHVPVFKAWANAYKIKATDTLQGSEENRKFIRQAYLTEKGGYFYKFPYYTVPNTIKKTDRVVVPTAILIGNYTVSAAEDFLILADNQQHMTTIGTPTYGSTGQPYVFNLPGGAIARVCTKKDTYPDGREFVGYGVQPAIFVKKTYTDYIENKDVVLEKALSHLRKQ